jgi:polysaccharide biosynthesis transport protein
MVDNLEEEKSESFDIERYLGIVRRRHLHFLIPLFVGWLVVWCASWVMPPRYKSSTLILVEQPTMPKNYVTPNVSDDLQGRLQSITEQILSRTRLLKIIDQFNLYSGPHAERSTDQKVARMRKDIEIELVRDKMQEISAFNVYYWSRDPHIAQQVTSELTNLFINENLEVRQRQSEGTTKFLESQLESARSVLSEQEERIRQFKAAHVGEMPAQLASNLQILSGLQSQVQNEEDALNAARQQHVYLQTLVDQYRSLQAPGKSGETSNIGLPAIDKELDRLKAQLADLSSHYTERHPDVRKLKEQISKTERMRSQLLAGLKDKNSQPGSESAETVGSGIEGIDPTQASIMLQVRGQLKSNEVEIGNRERAVAALKAKIEDYQARLNQEPIREQELADLTRGYDQLKENYDDLLKKKNESAMATSMELLQQGERFRIVDPPSFPQKPEFPNRLKFCVMGFALGVALGGVVAGAFEFLDGRLHTEKDLKKLLPVEIITEIPAIINVAEIEQANRRLWFGWAMALFVFASIAAGSAFSYLRG